MTPRWTRPQLHHHHQPQQEQQQESSGAEPFLAWDDIDAAAAWVGPVLSFLPGGMPEAVGGLGAVCRGARAAVVRFVLGGVYGSTGVHHSPKHRLSD